MGPGWMLVVICTPVPKGNSFKMRRVEVHHRYTRSPWIETELKHEDLENCALLAYGAASSGNSLPTFRDSLTAPDFLLLKIGRIGCPETSVRSYHYLPRNWPEESSSYLLRDGIMKLRMHDLLAVREINFVRSREQR